MSLQKLAQELNETARQSASMLEGIGEALSMLSAADVSKDPVVQQAMQLIVTTLQGQDRIEQRCRNMANAVRKFSLLLPDVPDSVYDEIWACLTMDELRLTGSSDLVQQNRSGEVELF